jgi:4'-phosphopantetheinyl transferase
MQATYTLTDDIQLSSNTISVYYGQTKHPNSDFQSDWRILDKQEQHQALQFKNDVLQQRYIAVHAKLRVLLARTLHQVPNSIVIHKTAHGKPYLADYPEWAFNLSHSGNVFAIAIGTHCQLGIDLEIHKHRANIVGLINKCFAPEEVDYFKQLSEAIKTAEFYRFWTRKEAFVKATGFGIALGLQHCVINPEHPDRFIRIPETCGDITHWYLRDIALPALDAYTIYCAISVNQTVSQLKLNEL